MTTDNDFGNDDLDKILKERRKKLIDDHFAVRAIHQPVPAPKKRKKKPKSVSGSF